MIKIPDGKALINGKHEIDVRNVRVTPNEHQPTQMDVEIHGLAPCEPIGTVVQVHEEPHVTITCTPGDLDRLLLGLRPSTRYWARRRDHRRGQARKMLEPRLGRAWRRFRRNFMPWVM